MALKLLTPTEIKQASEAERAKDINRIESVRTALSKAQSQLNEADAKFALMLANQQKRWAEEEEKATSRIQALNDEIKALEKKKAELEVPIEEEAKKAHDLFIAAEAVLADAKEKQKEVDTLKASNEKQTELLQRKLDEVSEYEQHALDLGMQNTVRALAIEEERNQIRKLSKELSIKLGQL